MSDHAYDQMYDHAKKQRLRMGIAWETTPWRMSPDGVTLRKIVGYRLQLRIRGGPARWRTQIFPLDVRFDDAIREAHGQFAEHGIG